jgi:hypothetical protein
MSVPLGVRRAPVHARRPFSRQVNCCPLRHALQPVRGVPPKPPFDRSTYSSLQPSKPDPEKNTAKVVETGQEDTRERVVILGSGWAGMAFHCQFKPGQIRCSLSSVPLVPFAKYNPSVGQIGHADAIFKCRLRSVTQTRPEEILSDRSISTHLLRLHSAPQRYCHRYPRVPQYSRASAK